MPHFENLDIQTLSKILDNERKRFTEGIDNNLPWEELKKIRDNITELTTLIELKNQSNESNGKKTG